MPHSFWVETISTIVYIMNKTPIIAVHYVTLGEKFTSKTTKSVTLEGVWMYSLSTCAK